MINKMEDNETTNPVKKIIWKKGIKTIDIWDIEQLEKIKELFIPIDTVFIRCKTEDVGEIDIRPNKDMKKI